MNTEDLLKAFLMQQMGRQTPHTPQNQQQTNKDISDYFDKGYNEAQKAYKKSKDNLMFNMGGTGTVPNMLPPLSKSKYSMDIGTLKDIDFRDMELKRNEGCYFRGTVMKKPWKMPGPVCAINVLLKDKNGDLARGNFYGVSKSEDWSELERIFPVGREVIVLHPFYKVAMDGQYTIRVENRYEFCFVDEMVKAAEEDFGTLIEKSKKLKDEGNQELKTKPKSAMQKYLKSVQVLLKEVPKFTDEKEEFILEWRSTLKEHEKKQALEHLAVVFSNCSLLETGDRRPLSALYYGKFSLWCNPGFFKANLRIARALIDLLHLHEAESLLKAVKETPEAEQFQGEITTMLNEIVNEIKKYSSPKIVVDFMKGELSWNDEMGYIGSIELFEDPNKGRGYRAMRDISKGETLLIEKGFVYRQHNPDFTYELLNKLNKRDDLKAMYMQLFPTRKYPLTKYLTKNLKGPLTESVRETMFSMFRAANPKQWHNFTEGEVKELLSKTSFNTFDASSATGLYPHCSFFNHSCDPNTMMRHKNDMVMVLATRNIRKGEEVCVPYIPLSFPKFKRRELLFEAYGIECNCERCCELGDWKEREPETSGLVCPKCHSIVKCRDDGMFICPKKCSATDFKNYEVNNDKVNLAIYSMGQTIYDEELRKVVALLKKVENHYPSRNIYKAIIWGALANYHARGKEHEEFLKYFWQVVELGKLTLNPILPMFIAGHLVEMNVYFGREPIQKEFEALTHFGFKMEVIMDLWNKKATVEDFQGYFEVLGARLF